MRLSTLSISDARSRYPGRVSDGDLIHADQHGAVVIPWDAAAKVKDAADLLARREAVMIFAAQEPGFNFERLRKAWGDSAEIH